MWIRGNLYTVIEWIARPQLFCFEIWDSYALILTSIAASDEYWTQFHVRQFSFIYLFIHSERTWLMAVCKQLQQLICLSFSLDNVTQQRVYSIMEISFRCPSNTRTEGTEKICYCRLSHTAHVAMHTQKRKTILLPNTKWHPHPNSLPLDHLI